MPRSLGGLDLPSAAARRIEARVQRKIQSIVARFVPPSNSAPWPECTCIHNTPTTSFLVTAKDGSRTTDLSLLDPQPDPGEPYVIGLYPSWYPDNLIAMTVSRSAAVVPSDRMIVSLASRTRWPKAIEAWNFCVGRQAEVFQPGPSDVPNEMQIVDGCGPGRTDTLNFNKPGFMGVWHTVLRPNESDFWAMLRGRRADFVWLKDPYTVDEE